METLFFTFHQNNSGGHYVIDQENGVAEIVIIEAESAKDAWRKLETIGEKVCGMFNFCGCCGERWSDYMDDDDGSKEPMIYGKPVESFVSEWDNQTAFVHRIDGQLSCHFYPKTKVVRK